MKYPISPIKERKKDGPWPLCYAEKLLKPQLSFSPPASEVIGKRDERKGKKRVFHTRGTQGNGGGGWEKRPSFIHLFYFMR